MSFLNYLADVNPPLVAATEEGEGTQRSGNALGDGPPPHMQIDYIRLNQKVTEAKDISGKVENLFIEERKERRESITEVWNKIREIQKELRDTRQQVSTNAYPKTQHVSQTMQMSPANSEAIMRESVELTRLEKEFANWKAQQQQSLQDLWTHVKAAPSSAMNNVSSSEPVGGGVGMKKMRDDVDRLDKMVMELQLNVSMAAIRASRIAMRTSELTERGKKEAIAVLEAKEQAITKQMEASRKERGVTTTFDIEALQQLQDVPKRDAPRSGPQGNIGDTLSLGGASASAFGSSPPDAPPDA